MTPHELPPETLQAVVDAAKIMGYAVGSIIAGIIVAFKLWDRFMPARQGKLAMPAPVCPISADPELKNLISKLTDGINRSLDLGEEHAERQAETNKMLDKLIDLSKVLETMLEILKDRKTRGKEDGE